LAHQLIKAGSSPLSTSGLSSGTIRNMIDNFGFSQELHAEIVQATAPEASIALESIMPGGFQFVAGPGTTGFDPISPLMIPGGVPSTINWPGLIRDTIDSFLGNPAAALQEGPLALPPQSPTPGLFPPGGLQGPLPTALGRTGGRASFITMPNGLPGCPTGYHPEKAGKPYCVRNRRMNPLNPRALSRATRRVGGFARAVKRARTLKKICRTL